MISIYSNSIFLFFALVLTVGANETYTAFAVGVLAIGCFHCSKTFPTEEIVKQIDSIIGNPKGPKVTPPTLFSLISLPRLNLCPKDERLTLRFEAGAMGSL